MHDFSNIVTSIKKAANDSIEANKPSGIYFGTVVGDAPLEIEIESKLILEEAHLVLLRNVTEHYIEMTVDHLTETRGGGSGWAEFEIHDHEYLGRKIFKVHKGLEIGEKVILARMQGGQQYVVLDRVGEL